MPHVLPANEVVRCPICGADTPYYTHFEAFACWCNWGQTFLFHWPSFPANRFDAPLERLRKRWIERGFGWSWFIAKPHTHGPEDFGDR